MGSYYPFGLKHKGYNNVINGTDHPYGFGGKEEQDELGLGWMDVTARNYDPALGRWMNIDPLAEKMRRHSPYNYAFDNPIFFIDADGMAPNSWYKDADGNIKHTDKATTEEEFNNSGIEGEYIAEWFFGIDQNNKGFNFNSDGSIDNTQLSKEAYMAGGVYLEEHFVDIISEEKQTKSEEGMSMASTTMVASTKNPIAAIGGAIVATAILVKAAFDSSDYLKDMQFDFSMPVSEGSLSEGRFDSAGTDSSKNERHGDAGALGKVEAQLEALESQLANATGKEAKKIKQKIKNVKQNAAKNKKGETHSRNAKGN